MIRLTVLYNLPEDADEQSYLDWRLTEHQETNKSMPGILRTDFARITDSWTGTPDSAGPEYRFMTTVDWPDRKSFEESFYEEQSQADLKENLKRLGDYAFLVSEILV